MNKEPFIINMDENSLPNLANDTGEIYGFSYDKTSEWNNHTELTPLLVSINNKLDTILEYIMKNGRE